MNANIAQAADGRLSKAAYALGGITLALVLGGAWGIPAVVALLPGMLGFTLGLIVFTRPRPGASTPPQAGPFLFTSASLVLALVNTAYAWGKIAALADRAVYG